MTSFRFQDPWFLLLVLLVLAERIVALLSPKPASLLFTNAHLFRTLSSSVKPFFRRTLDWLTSLGLVCLIIALARPQFGVDEVVIRHEGIAIAMCLDRSGSMDANDFQLGGRQVTRFEAVKQVFRDFVLGNGQYAGRTNDLIGLIAFGGVAETMCPLTHDHQSLVKICDEVQIPNIRINRSNQPVGELAHWSEPSTAISDGMAMSIDRLIHVQAKSRVLILLSDGEQNAGIVSIEDATALAKQFNIRVYAIGVGTERGRIKLEVTDGGQGFTTYMNVRPNFDTLERIAKETNGKLFVADSMELLRNIYREIDQLEKSELPSQRFYRYQELFGWFLLSGLALITLAWLFRLTVLASISD